MSESEYRVEGDRRVFTRIAEARKARADAKRGLPRDARVAILRKEECAPVLANGEPEYMWVPIE